MFLACFDCARKSTFRRSAKSFKCDQCEFETTQKGSSIEFLCSMEKAVISMTEAPFKGRIQVKQFMTNTSEFYVQLKFVYILPKVFKTKEGYYRHMYQSMT